MKKYKRKQTPTLRSEVKKLNWRKIGTLALSFVIIYVIYRVACEFNFYPILPVYLGIITVLIVAFLILNRGFDRQSPTPDMLPDTMTPVEKDAYIEVDKRHKAWARKLLYLLIPFILTIMLDMIWLAYIDPFTNS